MHSTTAMGSAARIGSRCAVIGLAGASLACNESSSSVSWQGSVGRLFRREAAATPAAMSTPSSVSGAGVTLVMQLTKPGSEATVDAGRRALRDSSGRSASSAGRLCRVGGVRPYAAFTFGRPAQSAGRSAGWKYLIGDYHLAYDVTMPIRERPLRIDA